MNSAVPPHYRAFRIGLLVLVLCALVCVTWYVLLPAVLGKILIFLGVG
jgi:hypothetical protein